MSTDTGSLLLLLNWMSPTFPIGSFAYSHAMEQAIADGRLNTQAQVERWLSDLLHSGSVWNDAVLFSLCWSEDSAKLNDIALALAGSAERFRETADLGRNFSIAAAAWSGEDADAAVIAYPVAAGLACRRMGIDKTAALAAFVQAACAAMVSVAVRLVPLGQTSGLKVLRALAPQVEETARRAATAGLEDLGSHCIAAEIAAMKHETLEPRIFRT